MINRRKDRDFLSRDQVIHFTHLPDERLLANVYEAEPGIDGAAADLNRIARIKAIKITNIIRRLPDAERIQVFEIVAVTEAIASVSGPSSVGGRSDLWKLPKLRKPPGEIHKLFSFPLTTGYRR